MTRARVRGLFAAALVAVTALWVLTTPRPWWQTPAAALVDLGSLAGLLGTLLLLQSVWLTSRFPPLERIVGLGAMFGWHRRLATAGLTLITVHVGLTVAGHARREGRPVLPEAWSIVLGWSYMLAAAAGAILLWAVALVSIRLARRRLRYEFWWAVHLYSYLGLGLALFHQLSSGAAFGAEAWQQTLVGAVLDEPARAAVAAGVRAAWVGAFVLTMATVLWYRLAVPALRSRRYALRIRAVEPVPGGAVQVSLYGRRLQALRIDGGQFANFRFARRGLLWQAHPYSFSGLQHRSQLYLTVGGDGDHARAVADLRPGTRVFFEGPYGTLTARAALTGPEGARAVMILVGGLGVTPICSLLRDLPAQSRPAVVYRVRHEGEALFVGELRRLATERMGSLTLVAGSRDQHPISAEQLAAWVPDASRRHVYVCGSRGFVDTAERAVLELGVPRARLTTEAFTW